MTTNIGSLAVSLSLDSSNFNGSIDQANRNLRAMGSELRATRALGIQYGNSVDGLRSKKDILTRSVAASTLKLEEERRKYDALVASGTANEATLERQAARVNNAQAQFNQLSTELGEVTQELNIQSSSWTQLSNSLAPIGANLTKIGDGMTKVGKDLSKWVTAPVMAAGAAAFKMAVDYESAFAGVRKTVDMTESEFATLSDGIRAMSKEIPAAATEIAGVAEAAGQLGIKKEAILGFSRVMVDLGVATNMSSEQAATALARFANITKMNQQDFDRLGSSVVDLGNNFATTEGEIVEMALRLAGAGAQVGMSEADILGLAAALSSVGIEAEMGGSAMSRVMVRMQVATSAGFTKVQEVLKKSGLSLRELQMMASHSGKAFGHLAEDMGMTKKELTSLLNSGVDLENFSKIAGMTGKEFKDAFEKDAVGALGSFINGLGNAEAAGDSAINMLEEMGISEIRLRDSLLRAGNANELFAESIRISNSAWKENVALTNEAEERYKTTASQMKILWNEITDVGISIGNILIPKVTELMGKVKPLIERFANMSSESQNLILTIGGIAAAIGPVLVIGGTLLSGLGGLITTVSGLSAGIAAAGGLTPALLGLAGPIGITVGVVGALGLAIYALSDATSDSARRTLESIEVKKKELDMNDELVSSFEKLQLKNKLSTDEVLRFIDIATELKNARTEEGIKALTDEHQKLVEKSGLTNEEMEMFLDLNKQIVDKAPSTVKAISEQGNAYASTLNEIKQLNVEERKRLVDNTYVALTKEMREQEKILEKQRKINQEIKDEEQKRTDQLKRVSELTEQIRETNQNIADLKKEAETATGKELTALEKKIKSEESSRSMLESRLNMQDKTVDRINTQIDKKKASLAETEKELAAFDKLADEYEQMILFQAGITSERGEGITKLKEEQKILDQSRKKLEDMAKAGGLIGGAYDEQNQKLNDQQKKIDVAIKKLEEMNDVAGKTVYKEVKVATNPTASALNDYLSSPINKILNITAGPQPIGYAKGTNSHRGGDFIAGEEGFELGRMRNKWEVLNFGMYNRPAGYQVFTHQESKSILNAANRMPAYATGATPAGEFGRVMSGINTSGIELKIISQMGGVITASKDVGKELMDAVGGVMTSGAKRVNDEVDKIANSSGNVMTETFKKTMQQIMKQADAAASGTKKSTDKIKKSFTEAFAAVQHEYKAGNFTATQYVNALESISAKYAKTAEAQRKVSEEMLKVDKVLAEEKKKLDKEAFDHTKQFIDARREANEISLTQELAAWERVHGRYVEGSEERIQSEKNIQRVRQEIYDQHLKASDEFLKKTEEINKNVEAEETRLNGVYDKALEERTNSIRGFASLFDEVVFKAEKTGEDLISNLRGQVSYIDQWSHSIEMLAKRGIDEGLLGELRDMGPKAMPELMALNTLTDKQLQEYEGLWRKKTEQARAIALKELGGMRTDTDKQISELHKRSAVQLEDVRKEFDKKIKEIRFGTEQEFNVMKSTLPEIGRNAMQGLLGGLQSMRGPLMNEARSIANEIDATMRKALQIKSPSKKTEATGEFTGAGVVVGMQKSIASVRRMASRLADAAIPNVGRVGAPNYAIQGGQSGTAVNTAPVINQVVNIHSPKHVSPSETARLQKRATQELALGW